MKFKEICESIKSGLISLEYAGHRTNNDPKEFLRHYEYIVSMANGAGDGKWELRGRSLKSANDQMRNHFQRKLDLEVEPENLWDLHSVLADRTFCRGCGRSLGWVLSGNQLQLRSYWNGDDTVSLPKDSFCEFMNPAPIKGEIKVSSRLIIANYFEGIRDEPQDKEHDPEWSLNHIAGCKRITEYKASKNVAYGQMGNMGIGIYVNKAKTSIIIGPGYHPAEEGDCTEKEYKAVIKKPVFEGHKLAGKLSLAVWRWEAADTNTIPESCLKTLGSDYVGIDVPYGLWIFEHYYETKSNPNPFLYSHLKLK